MAALLEGDTWLPEPQPICRQLPAPDWLPVTPLLLLILASPHLLYALVWLSPSGWRRTFGKRSVHVFATIGVMGKVLQFTAVLLWGWSMQPTGWCPRRPIAPWQWLLAAVLVGFGQALNLGTYRAIGLTGVYYGTRLGRPVPWVDGWPFKYIDHPQYCGSAMTVWGALALLHSAMPMPLSIGVAVYWTGLYILSAILEHYA